jgi:hypothetical protein
LVALVEGVAREALEEVKEGATQLVVVKEVVQVLQEGAGGSGGSGGNGGRGGHGTPGHGGYIIVKHFTESPGLESRIFVSAGDVADVNQTNIGQDGVVNVFRRF